MKFLKCIGVALSALVIVVGIYATITKKDDVTTFGNSSNENICKNLDRAIVVFREGCESSTALGFGSGDWDNKKKWCECVESKYKVQEFVDGDCSIPKLNVYMNFWNNDGVKVACGSPKEPK